MLKVGDKLIAKQHLLISQSIPLENREMTITYLNEHGFFEVEGTKNGEVFKYGTFTNRESNLTSDFYIVNNINYEIVKLLDTFEIREFNAVTIDGKILNISGLK